MLSRCPLLLTLGVSLALCPALAAAQDPPKEIQLGSQQTGGQASVKVRSNVPQPAGPPDRVQEIFTKKEAAARTPIQYYVVEDEANAPQIDFYSPMVCAYRPGSPIPLHIQCDPGKKECLVAEEAVFEVKSPDPEGPTAPTPKTPRPRFIYEPLNAAPKLLNACTTILSQEEFTRLQQQYTLKPALLEAPYGYKRDRKGRPAQTHFNLRDRLIVGVQYAGIQKDGMRNTLNVELRSTVEIFNRYTQRRHRFRFLEGELTLAPFEARVTAFEYDYGRRGNEPLFWLTTLVGEPKRYDVYLNVGAGLTLGRLEHRRYEGERQTFVDFFEGRLNWEVVQGLALEDYFMFRIGGGMGTRSWSDESAGPLYVYPEVGFKAAWLMGERGLWQLSADGRARSAYELETGETWLSASVSGSVEWLLVAISDQPVSIFVKPELNYMAFNNRSAEGEVRALAGIRLSLFVPPPLRPIEMTPAPSPTPDEEPQP